MDNKEIVNKFAEAFMKDVNSMPLMNAVITMAASICDYKDAEYSKLIKYLKGEEQNNQND